MDFWETFFEIIGWMTIPFVMLIIYAVEGRIR